jgi:uncharacterized protein with PQ loop repeat
MQPLEILALVASVVMPMWNIPLIVKIFQRKSSDDLSLYWLWGVWGCMLLMVPWSLITKDTVLRVFGLINFILFSGVVFVVMKYRRKSSDGKS